MAYSTSANLSSDMGLNDYNQCCSNDGSATADSTIVATILADAASEIDSYATSLTTLRKVQISRAIAAVLAYNRRGMGHMATELIRKKYDAAMAELTAGQSITIVNVVGWNKNIRTYNDQDQV